MQDDITNPQADKIKSKIIQNLDSNPQSTFATSFIEALEHEDYLFD